jgi:hypothetical protein
MSDLTFWIAVGALVGVVAASFFEWTLHRFVMHRPLGPFTYPFRSHALVHHQIFRADESYHLINEEDKGPFRWRGGTVRCWCFSARCPLRRCHGRRASGASCSAAR